MTAAIQSETSDKIPHKVGVIRAAMLPNSAQAGIAGATKSAEATEIVAANVISVAPSGTKARYTTVKVTYNQRSARLTLTRRPSALGQGWIQFLDDGSEVEINLAAATLDALLEA